MRPWVTLATSPTPDGTELTLWQRGGELVIRADGRDLMSNRMHGSEETMAKLALAPNGPESRVLVGGLGMGFTLRAALDVLPPGGRCTVVELIPAVVEWNRGPLAALAGSPLDDPRVDLVMGDVVDVLRAEERAWDSILLDVDNGPESFTQEGNGGLYHLGGLNRTRMALKKGGVLAVWSAYEYPAFEARLARAGFTVRAHKVRARGPAGGPRHTIYVGRT